MDWKTCFQGKKILVVEDDAINRDLMNDILTQMQCQVTFANDGNQAIEKVKQDKYDLILMDVRMPGKDGIETTKEIKATENQNKSTPIIALTAATIDGEQGILNAGMIDMISKPIDLEMLRQKMSKVLLG